jgi:hypothetical protein
LDIKAMLGSRPSLYWRIVWYIVSPLFLLVSKKMIAMQIDESYD